MMHNLPASLWWHVNSIEMLAEKGFGGNPIDFYSEDVIIQTIAISTSSEYQSTSLKLVGPAGAIAASINVGEL